MTRSPKQNELSTVIVNYLSTTCQLHCQLLVYKVAQRTASSLHIHPTPMCLRGLPGQAPACERLVLGREGAKSVAMQGTTADTPNKQSQHHQTTDDLHLTSLQRNMSLSFHLLGHGQGRRALKAEPAKGAQRQKLEP